jgi:hypothetical protein
MSRLGFLLVMLLVVGCEKPQVPGPPPEDSEADQPRSPIIPGPQKIPGHGHPDRLAANLYRAVRGDVEVWVNSTSVGARLHVQLTVRNLNRKKPLAFANWDRPDEVTLKDESGKAYPLIPLSAERERAIRVWEAEHPDPTHAFGAGPVTHDRARVTFLEFDTPANAQYLDLDLAGAPVGFADPIRFRIPEHMITAEGAGVPAKR